MVWRVSRSLEKLRQQVDEAVPNRKKTYDGTIGDEAHQTRKSDHNPDPKGIVRALDITNDPVSGVDSEKIAEALRLSRDPRISYVISNWKIASAKANWAWRKYTGPNGHNHHCHISVVEDDQLADDMRPWNINAAFKPKGQDDMSEKIPASIRYKNPGAMWGNKLAIKWGASPRAVTLNDGKGQGNNIAVFPTYVQGICAQLDLWRSSANYKNKRFADAIDVWDGGNETPSYISFVKARVPGISENTVMDEAFWRGPMAIPFLKAQAWHEAGVEYPAPEGDWNEAYRRVMGGIEPEQHEMVMTTVWLQNSLKRLGANIEVDGFAGPQTKEAVKLFQKASGLEQDGLVGPLTLEALNKALEKGAIIIHPDAPEIKLPPPGAEKPHDLAPTFWGRVWDLFKPKRQE